MKRCNCLLSVAVAMLLLAASSLLAQEKETQQTEEAATAIRPHALSARMVDQLQMTQQETWTPSTQEKIGVVVVIRLGPGAFATEEFTLTYKVSTTGKEQLGKAFCRGYSVGRMGWAITEDEGGKGFKLFTSKPTTDVDFLFEIPKTISEATLLYKDNPTGTPVLFTPLHPTATAPTGGTTTVGPTAPPAPVAAGLADRELYSQAYADYARGNYDLAIQGFTEYLKNYPDKDVTDNAQYWIGECLYDKKQYEEAIEAWDVLFRDYASSDKIPDARLKKGIALERLGRRSQALVEYRYVVDRYPSSQAARIAGERINPR